MFKHFQLKSNDVCLYIINSTQHYCRHLGAAPLLGVGPKDTGQ